LQGLSGDLRTAPVRLSMVCRLFKPSRDTVAWGSCPPGPARHRV